MLAILAGALAIGYDIHHRILAFNIGAATPLLVSFMARGLRMNSTASDALTTIGRKTPERPPEAEKYEDREHAGSHRQGPS